MPVGTENQEPEKHQRGEQIGLRIGEAQVLLHIVRSRAYEVDEPHHEEAEHHGNYLQQE